MRATGRATILATRHRSHLALVGASLLVALLAGGCRWLDRATPVPPSPSPAPPSTPIATVPVAPSASPSTSAGTWGPLAVVPAQDGADTARTEGTLRIADACVFLVERGGPVVLIWPADRTTWNARSGTITFANFDGTRVSAGDRTKVVLGGGGDSNDEDGGTTAEWLARTTWIAEPDPSCPLETRWWVGALTR